MKTPKSKAPKGFEPYVEGYKLRLRLLRAAVGADTQQAMADFLGITMQRWNAYERGYPVPREVAFLLHEKIEGFTIQWLWFGEDKLSPDLKRKIEAIKLRQS